MMKVQSSFSFVCLLICFSQLLHVIDSLSASPNRLTLYINTNHVMYNNPIRHQQYSSLQRLIIQKKNPCLYSTVKKDDIQTPSSKCPVTKFSNKVMAQFHTIDSYFTNRFLRLIQHVPALCSLFIFGFVSSISMMGKPQHSLLLLPNGDSSSSSSSSSLVSSLLHVLAQYVGPTSNAALAQMFPTFVTPASFVFIIWPIIALLQFFTLSLSILFPLQDEFLNGNELASLTTANILSITWLIFSSMASSSSSSSIPLGCVLTLPLVPFILSHPLRNKPRYILPAFQVYSSFTTLASFLAISLELQYGGRIPRVSNEISALIFLFLYSTSSLAVMKKCVAKRIVNVMFLGGILYQRWILSSKAISSLLLSISFWCTVGCFSWAFIELFPGKKKEDKK